jgi:hypothetical protein
MSYTRSFLKLMGKGFGKVGSFTCLPWSWACGEYDNTDACFRPTNPGNFTNNVVGVMAGGAVDLACASVKCCCRSPVACICSVITVPVGAAGATALLGLSTIGTLFSVVADVAVSTCPPGPVPQKMEGSGNDSVAGLTRGG